MPSYSSSLTTWVSDSSEEEMYDDKKDAKFQSQEPIAKTRVNTGGELTFSKDFVQSIQIFSCF